MEEEIDVPEEMLDEWKEVFDMFDKHGDANISTDDLGFVVRGLDRMPTQELLKTMIEDVDTDGNGSVDMDEFVSLMLKHPAEKRVPEEVRDAVQSLTRVKDDQIDISRLRHYLTTWGERLTEEEFWELENMLEADGNQRVPIDNIVSILCDPPGPPNPEIKE